MNNNDNYIAHIKALPEWFMSFFEFLTIPVSFFIAALFAFLFLLFRKYSSKLDVLFQRIFVRKAWQVIVTGLMGLFLLLDWALGVKALVVLRPFFLMWVGFAFYDLAKYYLELFDTTVKQVLLESVYDLKSFLTKKTKQIINVFKW